MTPRRWWLLLPVAWMGGLYYLSSLAPGNLATGPAIPHMDKVAHFVVYGGLVVCFWPWGGFESEPRRWLPFAVGAAVTFGLGDEIHQFFVPNREPEWLDVLADILGVGAAAWLCSRRWSRNWACRILRKKPAALEPETSVERRSAIDSFGGGGRRVMEQGFAGLGRSFVTGR